MRHMDCRRLCENPVTCIIILNVSAGYVLDAVSHISAPCNCAHLGQQMLTARRGELTAGPTVDGGTGLASAWYSAKASAVVKSPNAWPNPWVAMLCVTACGCVYTYDVRVCLARVGARVAGGCYVAYAAGHLVLPRCNC